jgi:hypothetical protein
MSQPRLTQLSKGQVCWNVYPCSDTAAANQSQVTSLTGIYVTVRRQCMAWCQKRELPTTHKAGQHSCNPSSKRAQACSYIVYVSCWHTACTPAGVLHGTRPPIPHARQMGRSLEQQHTPQQHTPQESRQAVVLTGSCVNSRGAVPMLTAAVSDRQRSCRDLLTAVAEKRAALSTQHNHQ